MKSLTLCRLSRHVLARLTVDVPVETTYLSDDHRQSLSARFRAVSSQSHRRLDAWMVERAGTPEGPFRWTPGAARRVIGNAALARALDEPALTTLAAVDDEVDEQLMRCLSGYAHSGSLAQYLASAERATLSLVKVAAVNWATQLREVAVSLPEPWSVAAADAYYDVARARTTLRGRRDLRVERGLVRTLVRVRGGAPGPSAGPGLRADLTIDALAHPAGLSAARLIGVWPEAGVVLSVDGTMSNLRLGARDLVRTAVAHQRHQLVRAA